MISLRKQDSKFMIALACVGLAILARRLMQRLGEADLRGQVTLVTGGSRGLGFLLAREFARGGCRVAICARDSQELDRARRSLADQGLEVLALQCDLSDRQQVERLVQEVKQQLGPVDILVNNAGIIQVGPIQAMTMEDFEDAVGVMFWGVLYPTLAVLPQMLQRKSGRIVNITSIGGKVSVPHLLPYNCAKFAAVGLSEGLGAELARHNISVTTVVPGLMRTGSYMNALFKGNQRNEFRWFSLGSSLPLISMDAERAASQIVRAAKRGEAEVILSMPANLLARFHGLFPGATVRLLGWVNRILLPTTGGPETGRVSGMEVDKELRSPLLDAFTALGRSSAHRFNQYPGPSKAQGRYSKPGRAA